MQKLLLSILFILASFNLVEAANRFAVCVTTCTWNTITTWSTSTGGATGASVPGTSDVAILDAATCVAGTTCTLTVDATVTVQQITMGACTASTAGCILDFSANNNNVTLSVAFSGTGTGTRTLNMGNGTWLMTGSNCACWDITTATNLTLNGNSSTLSFIPSTATPTGSINFVGGGKSYNIITHSGITNAAVFSITGAPTIATLQLTAPASVLFGAATTTTITNAFNWLGTSTNQFVIQGDNSNISSTIAAPANSSIQWAGIRRLTFTGNTVLAPNSFDLRSNSGVTITPPSSGGNGIIGG